MKTGEHLITTKSQCAAYNFLFRLIMTVYDPIPHQISVRRELQWLRTVFFPSYMERKFINSYTYGKFKLDNTIKTWGKKRRNLHVYACVLLNKSKG